MRGFSAFANQCLAKWARTFSGPVEFRRSISAILSLLRIKATGNRRSPRRVSLNPVAATARSTAGGKQGHEREIRPLQIDMDPNCFVSRKCLTRYPGNLVAVQIIGNKKSTICYLFYCRLDFGIDQKVQRAEKKGRRYVARPLYINV